MRSKRRFTQNENVISRCKCENTTRSNKIAGNEFNLEKIGYSRFIARKRERIISDNIDSMLRGERSTDEKAKGKLIGSSVEESRGRGRQNKK